MRSAFATALGLSLLLVAVSARAESSDTPEPEGPRENDGLRYLVPEMQSRSFHMDPGPRRYLHRLSFSPAYGRLGASDYYAFRVAYHPNRWLGYEANIGHNPAESVHALINTLSVVLRHPISGRLQPYVSGGYGMMIVFPGEVLNADPVTKNVLGAGAGLEIYIRNDVALRSEIRATTVLGGRTATDDSVNLSYREFTVGFSFYKSLAQ